MKRAILIFFSLCISVFVGFRIFKNSAPANIIPQTQASGILNWPQQGKLAYLTFDADMTAGMANELRSGKVKIWYSPGLIAYLEAEKIPATIFSTGMFAEIYPDLIRKLANEQIFAIENHTYDHGAFESPCFGLQKINSDQSKLDEMQKTQKIIFALAGQEPKYIRHPGLCHNSHDDQLAEQIGLKVQDGSLISGDAFNSNKDSIVKKVLDNVQSGSMIIMHLGGPNAPATEQALKEFVPKLKAQGYQFLRLN